jgi:hypothetical protein
VNILIWHVHGSWLDNFVRGPHTYVLPVDATRSPDGLGRARTWRWPPNVIERTAHELADTPIDVVIVQRPHEMALADSWLGGRRVGADVPVVWLEHNAPDGPVGAMRHRAADRRDLTIVHVTHTNALYWDTGSTRTVVIEHGVARPEPVWTGTEPNVGVVVNEPVRRNRITGTDLLPRFGTVAPIDVFGMATDQPSLIEAMAMGMPVVALATTDVPAAVTSDCGAVSNDLGVLERAIDTFMHRPEVAAEAGAHARRRASERYGIDRFITQWDDLLDGL